MTMEKAAKILNLEFSPDEYSAQWYAAKMLEVAGKFYRRECEVEDIQDEMDALEFICKELYSL